MSEADFIGRELLHMADVVAREKSIAKEEVLEAMEQAIQKVARGKYGLEHDIRAFIDRKNGDISLKKVQEIVKEISEPSVQITLEEAKAINPDAKIGEFLEEDLPPVDFGRVAAQTAKQVIYQKVRDAERTRQFQEYKDRVGDIVSGIIKRIEFGNVIVELGKAEALLKRDEMIPRETFRNGDRIRAYVKDVRNEPRGAQIFLSRTHPGFVEKLFMQEVPEIYDGVIKVKGVSRDPGSRAKMSVWSSDSSLDPVGACVGVRGSRVQGVVSELQGEKIDIIPWSSDVGTYVISAIAPAEVSKVIVDEEHKRIDLIVAEDQQSIAIGRRGQNVRLASELLKWRIDVMTEDEESRRRTQAIQQKSELFVAALDVDEVIAHLLIGEGFETIDDVAFVERQELLDIEGFDEDLATELQRRAREFVENRDSELKSKIKKHKIADDLKNFPEVNLEILAALGEHKVLCLDDLADLAADELLEMLPSGIVTLDEAENIIMAARAHWFDEAGAVK